MFYSNRRSFLKSSLLGSLALATHSTSWSASANPSKIAVTAGEDRTDNIFQGLRFFEREIKAAIGNRRVIIKPNNVSTTTQLAASHSEAIAGTLEFLKSIGVDNIAIAESAASGPSMEGYENFGYIKLAEQYKVPLLDLDHEGHETVFVFDEKDYQPHAARLSKVLLNRKDHFIISQAVMKTHDRVVATLSLKNIVFGAPIKDEGFRWGSGRKEGAMNDKPIVHGSGFLAINYNLFALAPRLHPDLAIIDGYEGMEGNGPVGGTAVEHRIAVVGTDWLAADRVAVELMGIDFGKIGYLNYCARAGYGQTDLEKIEVVGATLKDHIKSYRLSDSIEKQLEWLRKA